MERFPYGAYYPAPTPAVIDVDMDLGADGGRARAATTVPHAAHPYYPYDSYPMPMVPAPAPMPMPMAITESPDTYDPSHDYFDTYKLKATPDTFDPNKTYRISLNSPSDPNALFSFEPRKNFYKSWKTFVTQTLFGGKLAKKWRGPFRIGNDEVDHIDVYHFSESVGNEMNTILKQDASLIVSGTLSLEKLSFLLPSDFSVVMLEMGPTSQKRIFDNFLTYLARNRLAGVAYLPTNDILYIIPPASDFMNNVFGIKTDKVFALLQYAS